MLMTKSISFQILRFDPKKDKQPYWVRYDIPFQEKNTVLGALIYVQEEVDPTLGFRYGCRYKRCGLCSIQVNGKARMACNTFLQSDMRIEPLGKLPLIKDLVIDRRIFFEQVRRHLLYLGEHNELEAVIKEPRQGSELRSCRECLACLAACPEYSFENENFGGPYVFVKLAQLFFDPRERIDRRKQAQTLGISRCKDCRKKCYCPNGISIYRDAIKSLYPELK